MELKSTAINWSRAQSSGGVLCGTTQQRPEPNFIYKKNMKKGVTTTITGKWQWWKCSHLVRIFFLSKCPPPPHRLHFKINCKGGNNNNNTFWYVFCVFVWESLRILIKWNKSSLNIWNVHKHTEGKNMVVFVLFLRTSRKQKVNSRPKEKLFLKKLTIVRTLLNDNGKLEVLVFCFFHKRGYKGERRRKAHFVVVVVCSQLLFLL